MCSPPPVSPHTASLSTPFRNHDAYVRDSEHVQSIPHSSAMGGTNADVPYGEPHPSPSRCIPLRPLQLGGSTHSAKPLIYVDTIPTPTDGPSDA